MSKKENNKEFYTFASKESEEQKKYKKKLRHKKMEPYNRKKKL